ncbi:hypothetical protein V6N12_058726 [Hibiscus sabdariffa]|uniref:RNase H type-1 domain-containing protein n=1 Tax=Hibiscus sabdariffa TaxID=183260 RepID=A0ABR2ESY5_9ROSI
MSHFQELPDESTALIHSCGGLEIREPLLADANVGASSWNLNDPISRASVEIYISSDSANVEEIENVKVDGALCEMVSRDNNNISWVEGVDRAMNVKNGWTGVVFWNQIIWISPLHLKTLGIGRNMPPCMIFKTSGVSCGGSSFGCCLELSLGDWKFLRVADIWFVVSYRSSRKEAYSDGWNGLYSDLLDIKFFIETNWEGNECLVIESDFKVVLNWLNEPTKRP